MIDKDRLEQELSEIVSDQKRKDDGARPLQTVDQVIDHLRDLPDVNVDLLLFTVATDHNTGKIDAKFVALGNEAMIAEAARIWLTQRGYLKGSNPLLESLRGFLPPGHPLK